MRTCMPCMCTHTCGASSRARFEPSGMSRASKTWTAMPAGSLPTSAEPSSIACRTTRALAVSIACGHSGGAVAADAASPAAADGGSLGPGPSRREMARSRSGASDMPRSSGLASTVSFDGPPSSLLLPRLDDGASLSFLPRCELFLPLRSDGATDGAAATAESKPFLPRPSDGLAARTELWLSFFSFEIGPLVSAAGAASIDAAAPVEADTSSSRSSGASESGGSDPLVPLSGGDTEPCRCCLRPDDPPLRDELCRDDGDDDDLPLLLRSLGAWSLPGFARPCSDSEGFCARFPSGEAGAIRSRTAAAGRSGGSEPTKSTARAASRQSPK